MMLHPDIMACKKDNLIKKYVRGNIHLVLGRYVTKEEKDIRRKRVLGMKFI